MDLDAILGCILLEQEALDELSFKLEEQRLILLAGQHRYLGRATTEIDDVAANLAALGRQRAATLADAAGALGIDPSATLRDIAEALPTPEAQARVSTARDAMRATVAQINRTVEENRRLLAGGLAATIDALAMLGTAPSYDASGTGSQGGERSVLLDARA
ncbi:flagellar protein FlgN [Acidiferrimicrobium sp. IK]|uniref:flagellar protein FlgN n=1 Tax=Acidiferrimicrobium sp. IK TaxID=2871700 RepID=UPI0021CB52D8|nr:flagellar protein FlgN [Acidiferrimicrobium sp. IK]MCU4185044.1 flagellar protein FlgN [Acidiferrimicrobium sp. IK]